MLATEFLRKHGGEAATLMTSLDAAKVPSKQDWDNETTTWTFSDDSTIVVSGSTVYVSIAGPQDVASRK